MKRSLAILLAVCMFFSMLPVAAHAEELESFSVGEYKQDEEIPQGKTGKQYTFTPEQSGTYAFTGYVGSLTAMSLFVDDGTETIANYELDVEGAFGNGTCIFEAEAGRTYTLTVMVGHLMGGETYYTNLRLEEAVSPSGVTLSHYNITGSVGDELDLEMRFDPLWSIPEDYTWSVDDASVAAIDADGHLTLLEDGYTTVRLTTASGLSAQCNIEVITPDSVQFDYETKTGYVGISEYIGFEFEPYGASDTVTIVSSDPSVVNVTPPEGGSSLWYMEYLAEGTATLTITTAGGLTDSCVVTVAAEMERIYLDESVTVTVQPGDKIRFLFTVPESDEYCVYTEEEAGAVGVDSMPYYSSDGSMLYELTGGVEEQVFLKNPSSVVQTYTLRVVKSVPVERVEILGQTSLSIGDRSTLRLETYPIWATYEDWTWNYSDNSAVTISESGIYCDLTAIAAGTTDISVTMEGGLTAAVTVTVTEAEEFFCGESKEITLGHGEKISFQFTPEESGSYVFYMKSGGNATDPETGDGYMEDFSLSCIQDGVRRCQSSYRNGYNGFAVNMEAGTTYTLRASHDWTAKADITGTVFLQKQEEPERIYVTSDTPVVYPGDTVVLYCFPDMEPPFMADYVFWEGYNSNILELDYSTGSGQAVFTALSAGTTEVTAVLENGVTATYTVTVVSDDESGSGVGWEIFGDTLYITGYGAMEDYENAGDAPWAAYASQISNISIDYGISHIGDYAFSGLNQVTNIYIPYSVKSIGDFAFHYCTGLQTVTIPDGVTAVGQGAFLYCTGLESAILSDTMTEIPLGMFEQCAELKSVTIGANTAKIGDYAFLACGEMPSVIIPAGVTEIGEGAFMSSGVKQLIFKGSAPAIGENAFAVVTAEVVYPADDSSWTEAVRQSYGGNLTWKAFDGITVWVPSNAVDWANARIEAFKAQNPELSIDFMVEPCSDTYNVYQKPESAADVFWFVNDSLSNLLQANAIVPLSSEAADQVTSVIGDTLISTVTAPDGQIYGVPYSPNTWFMYYNKSIFSEEDVKSMEAMLAKGKVSFPVTNSWNLPAFYFAAGGTMFGPKGNDTYAGIQFGGEQGTAATKYLVNLLANENFVVDTDGSGNAGLRDGTIGAYFSGNWDYYGLANTLGEDLGAAQLPTIEIDGEAKQLKAFCGSKAYGVSTYCGYPEIAEDLAVFLGNEESQKLLYQQTMTTPTATALMEDAEICANAATVAELRTAAYTSVPQPSIPAMNYYWGAGSQMGNDLVNGVVTLENAAEKTEEFNEAANEGVVDPSVTTISLWTYPIGGWGDETAISQLIKEFEEAYPEINVDVKVVNYTNGDAELAEAVASGSAPDLILEGPERVVQTWGARGYLADLSGMLDSTDRAEIYPNALKAASSGDRLYQYPLAGLVHTMAINKTVFEAAGAMQYIDEETRTWKSTEDFFKAVQAVYAYTGKQVGAVYCGGIGGDQGTRALVNNLYGGTFTNADHTAYTWDSEENIRALQALYSCEGIGFNPAIVGGDEISMLLSGELNMAFCWNVSQQNRTNGQTESGDEIMFLAFPSDETPRLCSGVWGFGAFDNGDAARLNAAKTFIRYMCDSAATADAVRATGFLAARTGAGGTDLTAMWADDSVMSGNQAMMSMMGDYYQVAPNWAESRNCWWNLLQEVASGEDIAAAAAYWNNMATGTNKTQISVMAAQYSGATADWWAQFEADFEAAHENVDLVVDVCSWNNIYSVVEERIAAGNVPDILNIDGYAGYLDQLLPVRSYMSESTYAKFPASFLEQSEVNDTVWAVPDLASARALYYNKDILDAAGVNVPTTWEELENACAAIRAHYGDSVYPWAIDMSSNEGQAAFAIFTWGNGGGFLNTNGTWALNSDANVEAVEFAVGLYNKGYGNADPTNATRYDIMNLFAQGKVAMTVAPDSFAGWDMSVNYGIAAIPANEGMTASSIGVMDRIMCFDNDHSEEELAAITEFFDFFYDDARYTQWVQQEGFLPATISGMELIDENDPSQAAWVDMLNSCKFYPAEKAEWWDVRNGVIDVLQRALNGENVDALLNELQASVADCAEHHYEAVVTGPTCTEQGYTTYTCSVCGDSYVGDYVDALGHDYADGACTRCGEEDPNAPIVITQQPVDYVGLVGDTATFSVVAEGEGLKYQWYFYDTAASEWKKSSGNTSATMSVEFKAYRVDQEYRCEITDANGNTVTTDVVRIVAKVVPLVITAHPADHVGAVNDNVSMTVEATGNGLTYQWYYSTDGGVTWAKSGSPGFATANLQPILRAYRDGYQFYCLVTDIFGNTAQSNVASMTVKASEVVITKAPVDVNGAKLGELYYFEAEATGDNLEYRWEFSSDGGETWQLSWNQGYNTATLGVRMNANRDGYLYRCKITSGLKTVVYTVPVSLNLQEPSAVIVGQSGNVAIIANKTATFTVDAEGTDLSYLWYRSNDKGATWTQTYLSGYNTDTLSFVGTAARAAMYMCKVTDGSGKAIWSSPVKLQILSAELKILSQPESVTCASGATAIFTVEAQGDGLKYQWYASSDGGATWTASYLGGYNTDTFSFAVNATRAAKLYKCVITDAGGNTVETNYVSVTIG